MISENNNDITASKPTHNVSLKAADRFLRACPVRYDCRSLYVCLLELEYCEDFNKIPIILKYPEKLNPNEYKDASETKLIKNIKEFAFPFKSLFNNQKNSSTLVKFYTFVLTDANRTRLYGFCRSVQNGERVLCIVSHLPWHNVFINLLNRIATIINEKDTSVLYNFLEALYEYQLPDPGCKVHLISHDGKEEIDFVCPDRRNIPAINENRNLLKFFAFFDLNKLLKIFTALLLEKHILIVSKDIENLTSCALSLEYLIYPLEWLHTFASILPDNIDIMYYDQPFPYIYGIHTSVYQNLITIRDTTQNSQQFKILQRILSESFIILVDEREVLNCENYSLPKDVAHELRKKLKFFQNPQVHNVSRNTSKYEDLYKTGPISAFQDAVLTIVGNYRDYFYYNEEKQVFDVYDELFYQQHDVSVNADENEFFHIFRKTQGFEEFLYDRADYLKQEKFAQNPRYFFKDYIDTLFLEYYSNNNGFQNFMKNASKKLDLFRKQAKEKMAAKKIQNGQITNQNFDISTASASGFNQSNDEDSSNKKNRTKGKRSLSSVGKETVKGVRKREFRNAVKRKTHTPRMKSIDIKEAKLTEKLTNEKRDENENTTNELTNATNSIDIKQNLKPSNNEQLIALSYSSRSLSTSSTSSNSSLSSSNKTKQNDKFSNINLLTDLELCKYLNNDQETSNQLVDIYDNMNINNETKIMSSNDDNPFANDRFIDQFTNNNNNINYRPISTFKSQLSDNNNKKIQTQSFNLSTTTLSSSSTPTLLDIKNGNENRDMNDILIANTAKLNNSQSIIDEFDPIRSSNTQTTSTKLESTQANSYILPKPFEQPTYKITQQQQQQYSPYLVQQQKQQQQYYPFQQQPTMSTYSYNPQQSIQNKTTSSGSSIQSINPYLFVPTPFYQRPQIGHHSVPYPITSKTTTATTTSAISQQQTSNNTISTPTTPTKSLNAQTTLFDNNNSLI